MSRFYYLSIAVLAFLAFGCQGPNDANLHEQGQTGVQPWMVDMSFLKEFSANSKTAMNSCVLKHDKEGNVVDDAGNILKKEEDIKAWCSQLNSATEASIAERDDQRKEVCYETVENGEKVLFCASEFDPSDDSGSGRIAMLEHDRPENIVDDPENLIDTLEQMEADGLTSAELPTSPWSDSYWPIYQGILGARYADNDFRNIDISFGKYRDYVNNNSVENILQQEQEQINNLSPSEKYDLLVGDKLGTLTKKMWSDGDRYWRAGESEGKPESERVATWMGICHGWSPAAYILDRPQCTVKTKAQDGNTELVFYPSDIKALGSLSLANARQRSRFVGGRCNTSDPEQDETGRVKDAECFDNNPATWHMAVVNQIGKSKKSFVMDVTYDLEVWNQPVFGYRYFYFNPLTLEKAETLEDAMVKKEDFASDKFKAYRDDKTKKIVGIQMVVSYVVETHPSHALTDSPERDAIRRVAYQYDLELDENNKIIGGEWYNNKHPDFLWTPVNKTYESSADNYINDAWKPGTLVPASYTRYAQTASRYGQPLAKILYPLLEAANQCE